MRTLKILSVLVLAGSGLTACGATDAERGATGALIGGAAAAATGENVVNGALIGGAAGAIYCNVTPNVPECYNG
ncbi:hypothetical protein [Wenxinia marina]|uniref:Glycine zipper domain-containing protein n=1 Tax=Wenxinia marina DSM 24838 TaxID=1123501 RepID=A0A0D0NK43_9RHOB|nr:hypothetical protein [Wenxinia marina]KIQ68680.1 hypothetical protein Wenmar_02951 [Wenxinia marina DSM 24838]GGL67863.1 hypothetical protein GCM10011392_22940 [Wenxinia marina]